MRCLGTYFCRSLHGEQPQQTIKNCQKPSEISITKLHSTHLAFCKTPAIATKRTHQNADLQSEGAAVLAPHGAFRFTSGDGTSIDDGWSEAVVNKRSVWTLRRLRDEEETKKRCLSLYKGPAPERPTFPLPLPVRLFFRIDFWTLFFWN